MKSLIALLVIVAFAVVFPFNGHAQYLAKGSLAVVSEGACAPAFLAREVLDNWSLMKPGEAKDKRVKDLIKMGEAICLPAGRKLLIMDTTFSGDAFVRVPGTEIRLWTLQEWLKSD